MDSSLIIKSPPAVAKSRALRDPVPVREAVATELVAAKTVASPDDSGGKEHGSSRDDGGGRNADQQPDHAPHDLVVDPESREVIYRERDIRAAEREHPDQALLRQRAYHRHIPAETDASPADDPHADIKA
jgi:hypothetical protein